MSALPSGMPNQLLIDGQWRDSTSGSFEVFDPSTNTVITTVPRAGESEIAEVLESAAAAQIRWAARAPRERGEVLRKAFEMMIERREEIATLMSLENGKALPDARA
jgi:succinate-semialdehyde dehydrogenase / glutarate-semialdehyde dehydrogenase